MTMVEPNFVGHVFKMNSSNNWLSSNKFTKVFLLNAFKG